MKKSIRKVLSLVLATGVCVFAGRLRRCAVLGARCVRQRSGLRLRTRGPGRPHHTEGLHLVGRDEV